MKTKANNAAAKRPVREASALRRLAYRQTQRAMGRRNSELNAGVLEGIAAAMSTAIAIHFDAFMIQ